MRISIVGGGPAGAMAAIRLARAGASVTLFDPSHPREKPCGGGVTGRALALVSDLLDTRALESVTVAAAEVEPPAPGRPDPAHPAARVALAAGAAVPHRSLIIVSRAAFDRALLDAALAAGARLVAERALDVVRRGASMVVRTPQGEYPGDHVLGADGANSLVRRRVAAPFARAQLSLAAGYFVEGATDSTIYVKAMREYPGYLWSFPRKDHLAVGVCAPAAVATSAALRAAALAWIGERGLDRGSTLRPYAWPIPSVGFEDARAMTAAGPGWMLLGDAAGLVDPLTREGIYYALLSGRWAADALAAGSAARAAADYAERLRAEIQPELARAARLSPLFFSPGFAALFVEALHRSAAIREVFADLVAGVQPYCGLGRRLLATRQWALAARAIRLALTPGIAGTIDPVVSSHAS